MEHTALMAPTTGTEVVSPEEKGQTYNFSDQELIRQLAKSRLAQNQQLEYEDLDGYLIPPRSQFSMLKKPAVSLKHGKMDFNTACIRLFESVEYILPLIHPEKKKLTIVMCKEEESASVAWARRRKKDNAWVSKTITSVDFIYNIYKTMDWNYGCRYKALGHVSDSREGLVLVFELNEAIMFEKQLKTIVDEETGEIKKKQVKYYPDYYKDHIGKSYNDYVESRQINMFEYLENYTNQTYQDSTNGTDDIQSVANDLVRLSE